MKIIYQTILAVFLLLAASSCVFDRHEVFTDATEPDPDSWITLRFMLSGETPLSRANPAGGEDGDGRENEIFRERKLHDLNIFFCQESSFLLNAAADTPLTHLYFNLDSPGDPANSIAFECEEDAGQTVYTVRFRRPMEQDGHILTADKVRFITVANAGTSMRGRVATLRDLWDWSSFGSTWTAGSSADVSDGFDRFVMTTAYESDTESRVDMTPGRGLGSKENPFFGKTTLQRLCARIDVMYAPDNLVLAGEDALLKYGIHAEGSVSAEVNIVNILPVNVMSQPSYTFKKVTNGIPQDWNDVKGYTWGDPETTDIGGVPSNYVLEPHTLLKETLSGEALAVAQSQWYGSSATRVVRNEIRGGEAGKVDAYFHGSLPQTELGINTRMAVICYADENTQSPLRFDSRFLTGLVFRAIYRPSAIFVLDSDGSPVAVNPAAPEVAGAFGVWRYSPSRMDTEGAEVADVDESRSLYFLTADDARRYAAAHPDDCGLITGFKEGLVSSDENGNPYIGFYCYYNLWLRHYDDVNDDPRSDPHKTFPMQYAVVRNNIYRVALEFTGPGDPEPTMREPETMQARVFVRKWNKRVEQESLKF